MATYPLQGEIDLIKAIRNFWDSKKRPAVVVSINLCNELSRTVLVVPFTSDRSGGETPMRIFDKAREGDLESDSLATCDHILVVRKPYLDPEPDGGVSATSLLRIQQGIQIALGLNPG